MAKAVIFDKDGVIFQTTQLYHEMWKKTFAKFDKNFTADIHMKQLGGRSAKEIVKKHLDPDISEVKLNELLQELIIFVTSSYSKYVTPVAGIVGFLKELKEANFPVAMATSSRKEITDFGMQFINIRSYFKTVVTVADVTNAKPNPEIFLKAAKNLRIKPQDCVVFEDSFSGVEAARRAGMKVVLVMTSHTQKEIPNVNLAIKDFTKIKVADLKMI